jgi:protein O-mannosyl-transferase
MQKSQAWLLLAMAITVVVYWVGLSGPFVLDDQYNLEILQRWKEGEATLHAVLFDGRSGMFGRPFAFATLALGAGLGGYAPFVFKLGNLIVHLLIGGVVFALIRRIALRDPHMAGRAGTIAVLVATLWLLHPLNVGTVLYAIQRMAQLSVLCMLAGMWLYLAMRNRITTRSDDRSAVATLFIGIPLLLVTGFLSKENALLLPALCLVLELGC